jgi:2-oxoglutarate dehydrogenase E1 component
MEKYSYIANSEAAFIEDLHKAYQQNPESVDVSWQRFFEGFEFSIKYNPNGQATKSADKPVSVGHTRKEMEVVHLIRGYRQRGHLLASTNPIGGRKDRNPQLDLKDFNLTDADLDTVFEAGHEVFGKPAKLQEIVEALKKVYTSKIGFEYQYIRDRAAKSWLRRKIEQEYLVFTPTSSQKKRILEKLNDAVYFENFLQNRFLGKKRFSLEGGESTIPALDFAINRGADLGVEEVVIGMAHRGRLNVLTNIMQKPYAQVFKEFKEEVFNGENDGGGSGDVKYHMGYESQVETPSGKRVSLKLLANPSHLEAVNPVVEGYARARADEHYSHIKGRDKYDAILPILIHGDAAVAGQGIVYEVTQMADLPAYYTGGTLHFVINNQVGFTTDFDDARSSIYCSDVAKIIDAPILHVNGDDPEAVAFAMMLAIEFRQEFNKDVFVDMVCYRKYGHNENDEPRFTQPKMYDVINKQANPRDLYMQTLTARGDIDADLVDKMRKELDDELQEDYKKSQDKQLPYQRPQLEKDWAALRFSKPEDFERSPETGISQAEIDKIGKALVTLPADFKVLKQIDKLIGERKQMFAGEANFSWGAAELLSYGSILSQGKTIRFTGQDVQRGTFTHRHSVLHDVETNAQHNSLSHIGEGQGKFEIYNSLLSEYAVMGFEYGYAMANPNALVIWEAQFGDFSNGAQIMIDQFLAAAEAKWNSMNGLVLLLPHGYEGQGPEHSNARPERYLQLSADYNMYVCNITTPANVFHFMRRQLALPFRKPAILMSPKSMLRSPVAVSPMADFMEGTRFQETIADTFADANKVKKVLLCSGKVYWDLAAKQKADNRTDVAIVRVEQLHPFPEKQVETILAQYKNPELIWVQEEPENMGYWSFIQRTYGKILKCISRPASASPSTGYTVIHEEQQTDLVNKAFLKSKTKKS